MRQIKTNKTIFFVAKNIIHSSKKSCSTPLKKIRNNNSATCFTHKLRKLPSHRSHTCAVVVGKEHELKRTTNTILVCMYESGVFFNLLSYHFVYKYHINKSMGKLCRT